ncbi:HDIG domain-containing metalloprotein [Proteinivorax hydrogeniformans]|uniref:HDIG domain-containing metalloprotein n=1 Tax=Proteinivorax hydrogeniformans TaxID=1826727 RepID=A0AAU8HWL5_9FIRM
MNNLRRMTGIGMFNFQRSVICKTFVVVIGVILTYVILAWGLLPQKYSLSVGQVSPETIYAPRTAVDHYATEKARKQVADQVPDVYTLDQASVESSVSELSKHFSNIEKLSTTEDYLDSEDDSLELLREILTDNEISSLVNMSSDKREELFEFSLVTLESELKQGIKVDDVDGAKINIEEKLDFESITAGQQQALTNLILNYVESNLKFSHEDTKLSREEAKEQVEEIKILKDSKIVDKGEVVTEHHISQLESLGLQEASTQDINFYAGLGLVIMLVLGSIALYLYFNEQQIWKNSNDLLLLSLIFCTALFISKIFGMFSGFLIPMAMAPILIAIVFNSNLAHIVNIALAIFIGIITGNNFVFVVFALLSGMVGIYSVRKVTQRSDLTRAGAIVAISNMLIVLSLTLLTGAFQGSTDMIKTISMDILYGMLNGLIASVLVIGILPFFENIFGITTSIRLLELSNPNNGALKRLLIEAPGTYHHSIVVGNLAEAAANEVGADSLLVRVGAYYHDIGKINRPFAFIENQLGKKNPHDSYDPKYSSRIILQHVSDGEEMANKYKLPPIIKDLISQHHGTTKISYFYHKAKNIDENVDEALFKYNGPKPQTKEAAIIMLADSVEAAVRSIKEHDTKHIIEIIKKVINMKLEEGQLDECNITFKELATIEKKFVEVLQGFFHKRINYPS